MYGPPRTFTSTEISSELLPLLICTRSTNCTGFVLKTAPKSRFFREQDILRRFHGHPYFRQLVDHVEDPPCMVLEKLQCDALKASGAARLVRSDINMIAKSILEALSSLHEEGIAHTGKP